MPHSASASPLCLSDSRRWYLSRQACSTKCVTISHCWIMGTWALHNLTCLLKGRLSSWFRTWHLKSSAHRLDTSAALGSGLLFLTTPLNPLFWPRRCNCWPVLCWWQTCPTVDTTWPHDQRETDSKNNSLDMRRDAGQHGRFGLFMR